MALPSYDSCRNKLGRTRKYRMLKRDYIRTNPTLEPFEIVALVCALTIQNA